MYRLRTFLVALLVAGCGDDSAPPIPSIDAGPRPDAFMATDSGMDDGGMPDAGPDGGMPDGGMPDAGPIVPCSDPDAPIVEIVSPAPSTDPNADEVVVGDFVTVTCSASAAATPGARPVDPESVSIVRIEGDAVADSPAVVSDSGDFSAQFNLSELDNGALQFRCFAEDTFSTPRCGIDEIDVLLDRGPTILVDRPTSDSVHNDTMTLEYRIARAPIAPGDAESDVVSHELLVAGVVITDITDEGGGEYTATIDFTDRTVYPELLVGDYELSISATNERTPVAATRVHTQPFFVDGEGPLIEFIEPDTGELVGGRVRVTVRINDESRVDDATLVLRVGDMEIPLRADPDRDGEYTITFDASAFPSTVTELTLNATASDVVGNTTTVSQVVKLDSSPPIADLDPPDVRQSSFSGAMLSCSGLFDPVGEDAVNDGQVAGTAAEFRVRVHDVGNSSVGGDGTATFYAGLERVQLYFLDDLDNPLLVDTTGDGFCDSINPDVEPVPGDAATAVVLDLDGVSPRGTAPAASGPFDPGVPAEAYTGAFDDCESSVGFTGTTPICVETSPLLRAVNGPDGEASIYVKPPITSATCVGDAFDFQGTRLTEGWVCAAVRAEDELANVGVSPPLHVCFDNGVGASECPSPIGTIAPEGEWPSCTDGCIPRGYADYPLLQRVWAP